MKLFYYFCYCSDAVVLCCCVACAGSCAMPGWILYSDLTDDSLFSPHAIYFLCMIHYKLRHAGQQYF